MSSIAAVVLNFETPDDTILAVRSLQWADQRLCSIIVVDNGSCDGSVKQLRSEFGEGVQLIALTSNQGFSAGCNAGIRAALQTAAEYVLLVNSDVIVPPDVPQVLSRALADRSDIGIVAPVVYSRTDPDRTESAGVSYDAHTGRMRLREHGTATRSGGHHCELVEAVTGCAMLVRRAVFDSVGLLAEEYFYGFEDLDFCLHARERGFLTGCIRGAFVLHEGSRSIGRRSERRAYYATRNHMLLASRFPGVSSWGGRTRRLATVAALNVMHALGKGEAPRLRALRACLEGMRDFRAGRFGSGERR